jgi:hypothetical protein
VEVSTLFSLSLPLPSSPSPPPPPNHYPVYMS